MKKIMDIIKMKHTIDIKNETEIVVAHVEELLNDFLEQVQYKEKTEVSVVFCENNFIKELNLNYRNKDYATDVLSFEAGVPYFLGDIIISIEKADEQKEGTLISELEMLLCHGLLHLLGYDHEKSEEDYEKMMSLQKKLLSKKTKELKIK